MNVLITSAGRRTTLLRRFQEAVHPLGGIVVACDLDPLAPARHLADAGVGVPKVQDSNYLLRLKDIITEYKIGLVVPTIDPELKVLAKAREELAALDCFALISDASLLAITGDKWNTVSAYRKKEIDVPRSWLPDALPSENELPEQLFIKPRDGFASLHTYATTPSDVGDLIARVPNAIIQERLIGPEVTVDALLDFEGTPLHYVPRKRIRTLAGESIQGVTLDDTPFKDFLLQCLTATGSFGGRGPVTLQFFMTDRGPVLTEINPRFGGGFPLGYAAGGHYPEWILRMVQGERINPQLSHYQRDRYMTRYNTERFIDGPL